MILSMLYFSNAYAMYTPTVNTHELTAEGATGNPDYAQVMRDVFEAQRERAETVYGNQMMAENLKAQELQNKMLQLQLTRFLDAHPKIAKDIRDQEEIKTIVDRNSGLFTSYSTYLTDLKKCANHGNKYCRIKLREEMIKCKKRNRC